MSIQSEIDRLNAAKADIQSALVEGGQIVEPTDTLTDYAGKVRALSSGFAEQIAHHNEDSEAHSDIREAIPTKTSDLTNDEGFITNIVDSDLEVSGALRVTDHAVFQNGATVAGSLTTPAGEDLYLHTGNISEYAIKNGGGQVSGDYTFHGELDVLGAAYFSSVESDLTVNGSLEVASSSTFHDDVVVEGALFTTDEEYSYIHTGNISECAAPPIQYGTTDLTAGSSSLATGALYVVYE